MPLSSHAEQIRCGGDVIGGVGVAGVVKIGGEQRQKRLDIGLLLMPKGEARDGEAVPQIMRSQAPAMVEPGQRAGSGERGPETRRRQAVAARTEEECCVLGRRMDRIAVLSVLAQRL
jgi:hypothetical protein